MESSAGEQVEFGMIGSEGVAGITSLLGPAMQVTRCLLQLDSTAVEVPMKIVTRCLHHNMETRQRLLEFTQSYLFGVERVAA